jgi:Family of unknown function (DUF6088)
MTKAQISTATLIRRKIEASESCYWRHIDFAGLPTDAVNKTLSRLVKTGALERISKGLYYRPRKTRFGLSKPSVAELQQLPIRQVLHPAGISAANLLRFATQNAIQGEFATSAGSVPRNIIGQRTRLHTRRPSTWAHLSVEDTALLDFLRRRANLSELSAEETKERLVGYFREGDRFARLAKIAADEPPRVRAMLGAIGQEIHADPLTLKQLRDSLNPTSCFDFGKLRNLLYAKDWQAK